QEQLMQIAQENHLTCIMVTHDVDEALLLSDRIVMLTNGPESHIGQILDVKIPRPRVRMEVVNHPDYYHMRNDIIYFLNQQKRDKKRKAEKGKVKTIVPKVSTTILEKTTINLGFLPLTDAAPLIVAKEKGLFEKHGFKEVNLCQETSWKAIASGIETDQLDAAQMVAGLPLAMTLGMGNKTPIPMIIGMVLSRNGNAITLSNKFAKQGVKTLKDLRKVIKESDDKIYSFGVVHPASMHNLMLRYWLASGGIDPDQDVNLVVLPPSEMIENLREEKIDGYCVGAPWNTPAIKENLGYVIATDLDIWPGNPEKVLGVKEEWANENPLTHIALIKALLEACEYCDDQRNREEILKLISQPQYIGLSADYISNGFTTPYNKGNGEEPQILNRYNQFYFDYTNCPNRAEGLWILTQLARWGFIAFPKNWLEILERVRRVDIFGEAARQIGYSNFEPDREPFTLFDGVEFNPDDPFAYLKSFEIKRKIDVKEILIDPVLAMK
ncbi:MAG TPA: ABC transporter substrate-binding protein, partial [Allocoleopsis sp.]